jgi:hypothetical protein
MARALWYFMPRPGLVEVVQGGKMTLAQSLFRRSIVNVKSIDAAAAHHLDLINQHITASAQLARKAITLTQ